MLKQFHIHVLPGFRLVQFEKIFLQFAQSPPFGNEQGAADLMATVTAADERTNELSEQDVVNVIEPVLAEYPVERAAMFLAGHSMGSGGTWYIGGKYSDYWTGPAPMSGPFVQETGYPQDDLRRMALIVTEGTQTPSLDASCLLQDWLNANDFNAAYKEVNADHGGMIPLVLPDIFDYFDTARSNGGPSFKGCGQSCLLGDISPSRYENLSEAMQYLNGNYTREINVMRRLEDPLFRGGCTSKFQTC